MEGTPSGIHREADSTCLSVETAVRDAGGAGRGGESGTVPLKSISMRSGVK
jgi:hypothetical protein